MLYRLENKQMTPEYRIITFNHVSCALENFTPVVSLLKEAEWEGFPTVSEREVTFFPEPIDQMHKSREGMQILWDIAPYIAGGQAILEITRDPTPWKKVWLHLYYEKGKVREGETPAFVWEIDHTEE